MASPGGKPNLRLEDLCQDMEDAVFLRNCYSGSFDMACGNSSSTSTQQSSHALEAKREELLQKKKEIEERTLQSTQRSLSCLRDSEEIGIATAQELVRQREQLERTEKKLDDISTTLRFSQRHIQGIKSVFGGLKNWISKKPEQIPNSSPNFVPSDSPLNSIIKGTGMLGKLSPNSDHPGLRIRGLIKQSENSQNSCSHTIENNLDEMLGSVSQLKVLAHGLGEEIESHNEIIENVMAKTERIDDNIARKNKDMKRLLK